jgi:hypothetical protein
MVGQNKVTLMSLHLKIVGWSLSKTKEEDKLKILCFIVAEDGNKIEFTHWNF